jgi:PPOX class probable FMN-dependent enzyme
VGVTSPTSEALAVYRAPNRIPLDKVIDRVDDHCRAFIEISPWATLATADADGWPDVSPRGGERGFVKVLDEHRLALPDRPGNNRIDSLRNIAANPKVSLMFLVPRIEEVLRVYGTATIVGPDDLGTDLTEFGKPPLSVLVVDVQRAYFQCAKSLIRSGMWAPDSWGDRGDFPAIGKVFRDHCDLPAPLPPDDVLRAGLLPEL